MRYCENNSIMCMTIMSSPQDATWETFTISNVSTTKH